MLNCIKLILLFLFSLTLISFNYKPLKVVALALVLLLQELDMKMWKAKVPGIYIHICYIFMIAIEKF